MIQSKQIEEIMCSAGRGKLPKDVCLLCAKSNKNTCGYDYSILSTILKDNDRYGIHVSDIVHCLRRAWYDKTTKPVEYVHNLLYRLIGTSLHANVQLNNDGCVYQSEYHMEELGIVGTADIVYENGRIIDLKTTRWLTPSKLPYGEHVLQLQIYAAMLRAMGKKVTSLAIQYVDMSGPSKCKTHKVPMEPVDRTGEVACPKCGAGGADSHLGAIIYEVDLPDYEQIETLILERRNIIQTSIDEGVPPERERSFLCSYCSYSEQCLGDKNNE